MGNPIEIMSVVRVVESSNVAMMPSCIFLFHFSRGGVSETEDITISLFSFLSILFFFFFPLLVLLPVWGKVGGRTRLEVEGKGTASNLLSHGRVLMVDDVGHADSRSSSHSPSSPG